VTIRVAVVSLLFLYTVTAFSYMIAGNSPLSA
jgi:hypothetical protein